MVVQELEGYKMILDNLVIPEGIRVPEFDDQGKLKSETPIFEHLLSEAQGGGSISIYSYKEDRGPRFFFLSKDDMCMSEYQVERLGIPKKHYDMHMRYIDGQPMYAFLNGFESLQWFHTPNQDTGLLSRSERKIVLERHFLISDEEIQKLCPGDLFKEAEQATEFLIEHLKPAWKKRAEKCMQWMVNFEENYKHVVLEGEA